MMRFHLLDRSGTTYVGFMDGATDKRYLAELNGVGAGSFAISANDPKVTAIAAHQIVRVDMGNDTVGHWLIERIEETIIDAGEDVENMIQVSGRGILTQLDRAVIYPFGFPGEPDTDVELAFAPSFGDGWFNVLNDAAELPFDFSFDVDDDSAGDPWPDSVDTSFKCNATMLEVMQTMAALGIDMLLEPDSLTMAAYPAPVGEDLTGSVIFRQGRDVQQLKRTTFSGDLANAVRAITGLTTYTEYADATSVSTYGKLQVGIDVSNKADPSKRAETLRDRLAYPLVTTDLMVNTATFMPFIAYALGDTITLWTNKVRDEFRIKAIEISQADAKELQVALQLSDRAMSFLERLNVSLRRSELALARVYGMQDA